MKLEPAQKATIIDLSRMKIQCRLAGLDSRDRPVLWIKDARRELLMVVRPDGSGREHAGTIYGFTDSVLEETSPADIDLLCSLGFYKGG